MRKRFRFLSFSLFFGLTVLNCSCQQVGDDLIFRFAPDDLSGQDQSTRTGYSIDGDTYTSIGRIEDFSKLKTMYDGTNHALAERITGVDVTQSENNLSVAVKLEPVDPDEQNQSPATNLVFHISVQEIARDNKKIWGGRGRFSSSEIGETGPNQDYLLEAFCENPSCDKYIEMHLLNNSDTSQKAGVMYIRKDVQIEVHYPSRLSEASGEVVISDEKNPDSFLFRPFLIDETNHFIQESFVVLYGKASSKITVTTSKDLKIGSSIVIREGDTLLSLTLDHLNITETSPINHEMALKVVLPNNGESHVVDIQSASNRNLSEEQNEISTSATSDQELQMSANLVGNSSLTGDVVFDLYISSSTNQSVTPFRIYVRDKNSHEHSALALNEARESRLVTRDYFGPKSFFHFISRAQVDTFIESPLVEEMVTHVENYRHHPMVLKYIEMWQGEEDYLSCENPGDSFRNPQGSIILRKESVKAQFERFLTSARFLMDPSTSHFIQVMADIGIPPYIILFTLVESTFPFNIDRLYPIEVNSSKNASGPFQILPETAQSIIDNHFKGEAIPSDWDASQFHEWTQNLTITSLSSDSNYTLNPRQPLLRKKDPRGYFMPSALLSAFYSKFVLFPQIRGDTALWPLSYIRGEGNVAKSRFCIESERSQDQMENCSAANRDEESIARLLRRDHSFETSFRDVMHFNIGPCDALVYSLRFLSAMLILSRPQTYGFSLPDLEDPSQYISKDVFQGISDISFDYLNSNQRLELFKEHVIYGADFTVRF